MVHDGIFFSFLLQNYARRSMPSNSLGHSLRGLVFGFDENCQHWRVLKKFCEELSRDFDLQVRSCVNKKNKNKKMNEVFATDFLACAKENGWSESDKVHELAKLMIASVQYNKQ